jgi:glycosyltransferase involved in cell wall biosynthesis
VKRIFLHLLQNAQGYYRGILPDRFCAFDLHKDGIQTHLATHLRIGDGLVNDIGADRFDGYIFHHVQKPAALRLLDRLDGPLAWTNDDDIWHVPDWNPASKVIAELDATDAVIDRSSVVGVSTDTLKKVVNVPDKTVVCPNLIDLNAWEGLAYQLAGERAHRPERAGPVRILWAGSGSHDHDLNEIVPAVERLVAEYKDKIQFLFFGYLPDAFCEWVRIPGSNRAISVPKERYEGLIGYIEPVHLDHYFGHMTEIAADIALAPLTDHQFNYSRSNLKWLEYTMSGAATVATALPPYECIEQGQDGLLVLPGDSDGWYYAIKNLIEDVGLRQQLATDARKKVEEEWSWQHSPLKERWLELFRRVLA